MKHLPSIEERVEEFDESLLINGNYYLPEVEDGGHHWNIRQQQVIKDVKQFCKTTLTSDREAIKQLILEWVEKSLRPLPKKKCINAENHLFGSCFQCENIKGYNSALKDLETFIKEEV